MSQMITRLKQFWQIWHRTVTRFITQLALSLVYIFGIGGTSIVAKLSGKKFLQSRFQKSSWQPITGSNQLEKMF